MNNPERPPHATSPMRLLHRELLKARVYADILIAFEKYLEKEYPEEDLPPNNFVSQLVADGRLPTAEEYEADEQTAFARMQIAIYDYLIPLYEETHSQADSDYTIIRTIPGVFVGRHDREECRQPDQTGSNCEFGLCPVRHMHDSIMAEIEAVAQDAQSGLFSTGYFLKRQRDLTRRLEALESSRIISPQESNDLWQRLVYECSLATNPTDQPSQPVSD